MPAALGKLLRIIRRFQPLGKDDQIEFFTVVLAVLGGPGEQQPAVENILHLGRPGVDHPEVAFSHRPLPGCVEALAVGADIHVKEGDLAVRIVLAGQGCLLDGVHAADRGTVVVAAVFVTGADALEKSDFLRVFAVGGTQDLAAGRAGGAHQPLVLKGGDHIL